MDNAYTVGDLIYDANIYDGMNTNLADLQFYKRWLPKHKDARILELCCGTGRLTIPLAKDVYWTSTEKDSGTALLFNLGNPEMGSKINSGAVRSVRAF